MFKSQTLSCCSKKKVAIFSRDKYWKPLFLLAVQTCYWYMWRTTTAKWAAQKPVSHKYHMLTKQVDERHFEEQMPTVNKHLAIAIASEKDRESE